MKSCTPDWTSTKIFYVINVPNDYWSCLFNVIAILLWIIFHKRYISANWFYHHVQIPEIWFCLGGILFWEHRPKHIPRLYIWCQPPPPPPPHTHTHTLFSTVYPMWYVVAWLCAGYIIWAYWIHPLPIFIKVAPLALGQSYDCPSASEVTMKDMGKFI